MNPFEIRAEMLKMAQEYLRQQQEINLDFAGRTFEQLVKEGKKVADAFKSKRGYKRGGLAQPNANQTGLKKLPTPVRNKMGYMNKGGMPKKKAYAKGGKVAMYNEGGMVRNTGSLNTGIKKA